MERHGDAPELLAAETAEEEIGLLADRISAFHRGGYNALGIITRRIRRPKSFLTG